jgi:hypothetical protein
MGLLDDAIREHLELKRSHGAPDDEIERAEQEALGPARRDPADGAGVPPVEEIPGDELPAGDHEPPPPPPPVDDPVFADEYATEPAPADFDEPPLEPEPEEPRVTSLQPVADEPELEEEAPLEEPVQEPEEPVEPDRASTSILDDPLAEGPPPAEEPQEDVLEETPEFLQDTPEHDKLWFEQKPPRDFDFE